MTSADSAAPDAERQDDLENPRDRKDRGPQSNQGAIGETVEVAKTVIYALLIALVLRIILFQPYTIPSASMQPNLFQGDYIIVSKYSYGYSRHSIPFSPPIFNGRLFGRSPQRGDIIVFKLPRDGHTDYIKRVIGLPGDTVQVKNSRLWLNGKPVQSQPMGFFPDEQNGPTSGAEHVRETLPGGKTYVTSDLINNGAGDNTGVYVVPKGCYFMMGDNRDNSLDSRFDPMVLSGAPKCQWNADLDQYAADNEGGVGFVPAENLVGKAQLIMLSWYPEAKLLNPISWFTKARPSRFFRILH